MKNPHKTHIVALTALLGIAASNTGHAQSPACLLANSAMLEALDGGWTIDQDATIARGGLLSIPIPASSTRITFDYDEDAQIIEIRGGNLEDDMILFPTSIIDMASAIETIGGNPEDAPVDECAWDYLPILTGTNAYYAYEGGFVAKAHYNKAAGTQCERSEEYLQSRIDLSTGSEFDKHYINRATELRDAACAKVDAPVPEFAELDMEMTLTLRFLDRNYGAGTIIYSGRAQSADRSARFYATAGVTLTR